jgi:hypothetical protein
MYPELTGEHETMTKRITKAMASSAAPSKFDAFIYSSSIG